MPNKISFSEDLSCYFLVFITTRNLSHFYYLCFTAFYIQFQTPEKKINKSLIDIEKLGKLSPKLSEAIAASTSLTTLEQGLITL